MKFKQILSFIVLSSSMLFADNFRSKLVIPCVNVQNPYWEFSHQIISEREEGLFEKLIIKWDDILQKLYTKLDNKIYAEIRSSISQINYYLNDQRFIDVYTNFYRQGYPDIMYNNRTTSFNNISDLSNNTATNEQEIDGIVLNFVERKLCYLKFDKPVKICCKDNFPLLATSFGTDKSGHYLVINKNFYSAEQIESLYELETEDVSKYFIEPHTNLHKSRAIEYSNLLHLGITQALSSVIHQGDFFARVLQIFTYNKKQLSKETQRYGSDFVLLQSYLEACLQSKNPYEIALFLEPKIDNCNQEVILLWREFIEDIQNCYNEDDLASYEALSLHERRAILYTHEDDEY